MIFHGGDITYSNSELLISSEDKIKNKRNEEFKSACRRNSLTLDDLKSSIKSWKNAKLIVLGDTILDRYAACEALGMSAEASDFNFEGNVLFDFICQIVPLKEAWTLFPESGILLAQLAASFGS